MDISVTTPTQTRDLGARLAKLLRAGDLVMLSGELGAGKTTLTQGIGAGLGVAQPVSSPTFIVARVHPAPPGGLALIHADAYRITSLEDLETLDLDTALDRAVVVVEWGSGLTEGLSEDRLEIQVQRPQGGFVAPDEDGVIDLSNMDDGRRTVSIRGIGPRWADVDMSVLLEG